MEHNSLAITNDKFVFHWLTAPYTRLRELLEERSCLKNGEQIPLSLLYYMLETIYFV